MIKFITSILFRLKKKIFEVIRKEGYKSLFLMFLRRLKFNFYVKMLKIKIKKLKKNYQLESIVDFVFLTHEGLIKPFQIRSEILEFLRFVKNYKPKIILEIGTARGGTLFLLSRVLPKDAIIISLDLPKGEYGGGYQSWKINLYKSFALSNQKIHLIRGNSHDKNALNKVRLILKGKKLDLLYIDGDHSYEGVKQDFEMYKTLVKKTGIIAIHDIVPCNIPGFEVNKFWNYIKKKYEYIEFVENWNQNLFGYGIIKFNNKSETNI